MNQNLEISWVSPDSITPYPQNPRKNDSAVPKVAESLRQFGWRQPIVVDSDGVIVAGHTRWKAAKSLGLDSVPVHRAELTPEAAQQYRIADNRTAQDAEWDKDLLRVELADLEAIDPALIQPLGFDEDELAGIMAKANDGLTDPDATPEPPDDPITKPGDIWQLGRHRLMCGDSTSADDVKVLLGGSSVDLILTDPPYSVDYNRTDIERGGSHSSSDSYIDPDSAADLLSGFMNACPPAPMVMTYPVDRHFSELAAATIAAGFSLKKELVWVKNRFSFWPGAHYQQKHEPILVFDGPNGHKSKFFGEKNQSTVFECSVSANKLHPTMRPVDLWVNLMVNHSLPDSIVYDPFSGSGTTIIAGEKTSRSVFSMELSPHYVDVAVRRWEEFTGEQAVCLSAEQSHSQQPSS